MDRREFLRASLATAAWAAGGCADPLPRRPRPTANDDPLTRLDGIAQAELVARGELTAALAFTDARASARTRSRCSTLCRSASAAHCRNVASISIIWLRDHFVGFFMSGVRAISQTHQPSAVHGCQTQGPKQIIQPV